MVTSNPEADLASSNFYTARELFKKQIPFPTPSRVGQIVRETEPKIREMFDQKGVFTQYLDGLDQEEVVRNIAHIYGLIHDYSIVDRLILSVSPRNPQRISPNIFVHIVEDSTPAWERWPNGLSLMPMDLESKSIPEELSRKWAREDVENRRIGDVILKAIVNGIHYHPTDAVSAAYNELIPSAFPIRHKRGQNPERMLEIIVDPQDQYIGELVPQKPTA